MSAVVCELLAVTSAQRCPFRLNGTGLINVQLRRHFPSYRACRDGPLSVKVLLGDRRHVSSSEAVVGIRGLLESILSRAVTEPSNCSWYVIRVFCLWVSCFCLWVSCF